MLTLCCACNVCKCVQYICTLYANTYIYIYASKHTYIVKHIIRTYIYVHTHIHIYNIGPTFGGPTTCLCTSVIVCYLLFSLPGFAVDWWSMGVILYEMLLGFTPFCSTTVEDLFEEITNGILYEHVCVCVCVCVCVRACVCVCVRACVCLLT